ncbi:LOW QUALITY PROTEIN: fms-related tyrosine kinase 3 ligand [Phalacrocorax aristotelis]|uniref:LOW QUALITY PROTEIN: fms-related tyrosine kinase 3 ligand n=1 Tax=Phalacrocorax aristotelis TaxID=126867 RepID=UPI003F4B5322
MVPRRGRSLRPGARLAGAAAVMAALGLPPVPAIFSTMEEGPRAGGATPGEAWLEAHGRALGHFVAGTWLKPPGRGTLECREAATGRLLATVLQGEEADLAAAVEAAAAAAAKWGRLGGPQRAQHLQRFPQPLCTPRLFISCHVPSPLPVTGCAPPRRCESSGVPPGSPPGGQGTPPRPSWTRSSAQSQSRGVLWWPPTPLTSPQPWRPPAASPWVSDGAVGGPQTPSSLLGGGPTPGSLLGGSHLQTAGSFRRWGRLPGAARARVLRGAAAALGGGGPEPPPRDGDGDDGDDGRLRAALLRWAAHVELMGGVVQEVPGGRALVTRRPLGVVGVAWSGPRPLRRALELLPPALALGNGLVVVAPPSGVGSALRLRQALVAAGLPGGALAVLPGGAGGAGVSLERHRPDGLWLCGGGAVPLLLLLDVSCPSGCCSFEFNPISSTFRSHVDDLSSWLILDYPVAMPSNLEMDSHCSDLWGLHFVAAALRRMAGVAGVALAPQLQAVATHITFVTECHIHDPQDCVRLETVNVSQLLGSLVQHLGGLQGRPLHFPGCARLRCRPGTPRDPRSTSPPKPPGTPQSPPGTPLTPHLPPGPPLTTPAGQHEGTLGSRLGPPGIHGPVLLGGLGGALALAAVAWVLWRRPCAQAGLRRRCGRIAAAGEMGTPRISPGGTEGPWGPQGGPSGRCRRTPQSHGETGGPRPPTATTQGP